MSTSDRDDMTTVVMACEEFMASTGIAPERYFTSDPAGLKPLLAAVNAAGPGLAGKPHGRLRPVLPGCGHLPCAQTGTHLLRL